MVIRSLEIDHTRCLNRKLYVWRFFSPHSTLEMIDVNCSQRKTSSRLVSKKPCVRLVKLWRHSISAHLYVTHQHVKSVIGGTCVRDQTNPISQLFSSVSSNAIASQPISNATSPYGITVAHFKDGSIIFTQYAKALVPFWGFLLASKSKQHNK